MRDPRVVFNTLFGAGATPAERMSRMRTNQSILDWVTGRMSRLSQDLGPTDRQKLERYLDNVREVERRIQIVEARNTSGEERALPGAPAGVPDSFEEHMKLMFDVQALAFESDMTRIFSFKIGRDSSNRVFPESGTTKSFHPASHHGTSPEAILDFHKINKYRTGMLPHLLERLESTMEGDDNLLHKSLILVGSPMGNANLHNHRRCPLFTLGHANGKLKGGMHLKAPDGTPMANAMLSMLHSLGINEMESFGDSTGEFSFNPPVTQ
jgi:hypothetical protein